MFEHKADLVVDVRSMDGYVDPLTRSKANPLNMLLRLRRAIGFGRTLSKKITTSDKNGDGHVFVRLLADGPWRAVLRDSNGNVKVRVDMSESKSSDVELSAGEYTVSFEEV